MCVLGGGGEGDGAARYNMLAAAEAFICRRVIRAVDMCRAVRPTHDNRSGLGCPVCKAVMCMHTPSGFCFSRVMGLSSAFFFSSLMKGY